MADRPPTRIACLLALLLVALPARGDAELPIGRNVGQLTPNFTLKDAATGRDVSLYGYRGKKAAVLVFTGTACPVNDLYMPRLVELNRKYAPQGVVFLAINSNALETADEVAAHAKGFGVDFPVLKDPGNRVADLLLGDRTCETLVLDGRAILRYRGAIDDQYGLGKRREKATHDYVADSLDAILAGRPIDTTASTVAGCPIERADATAKAPLRRVRPAAAPIVEALAKDDAPIEVGPVTYSGDVAAIFQQKCQNCHRPGQVGPFPLQTYDDARKHKAVIREVVDDRRMPPWHADPRYGHFENDRSLTPKQRATVLAWIDQGLPLGDPSRVPAPPAFPDGWTVGTPDVVFTIPADYIVAAQGELPYQHFVVPTGFTEDRWVQVIEARPGDRTVIHHIIIYLLTEGGGREHLGGYAPGDMPSIYRDGAAKKVPAGSRLLFEVHYTPNGKVRIDRSSVGLTFAKGPVEHRAITHGIANGKFAIPPGDPSYEVKSSWVAGEDVHLLAFMPHMHLRGKDFQYSITFPDGRSETLLSVPAYDFGWQSYYRLSSPLALPKGTRISCVAHFDNSTGNPANPDPTAKVRWGDQTREEMMIGYIDYQLDRNVNAGKKP